MKPDELETLLRRWGRVFGQRPPAEDGDERPARATHPLARGMEFSPRRKRDWLQQRATQNRDGRDRRAYMAASASAGVEGGLGLRMVPMGFVDPVPCVETRSYRSEARDWPVPPEIARVERAALDLQGFDETRGLCLRMAYCVLGDHPMKAKVLGLKVKRFRDELKAAKIWIHARLTA